MRAVLFACASLVALGAFEACGSLADSRPNDLDAGQDVSSEAPSSEGSGGAGGGAGASGAAGADPGCLAGAAQIDPSVFPTCQCAGAHCVDEAFIGGLADGSQAAQLADCEGDPTGKCVPDEFIASAGKFVVRTCQSIIGAEGRCLSTCLPAIQAQADRLPKDVCDEGELCAPCFDPTNGSETGACSISCDPGPAQPKKEFDKCCADLGVCVPQNLVPVAQRDLLGADSCTAADTLCAPALLVSSDNTAPVCRSVGDSEGRCIPACLPAISGVTSFLPRGSCEEGMLCAPCYDPRTGGATGACSINGDSPQEPPYTFPKCCGGDGAPTLGTCVPQNAVPPRLLSLLSQDTCPDASTVCAPDVKVADLDAQFTRCTTTMFCDQPGGCWPGACVPACIIPEDFRGLPQTTCQVGEICAPCEYPIGDGGPTGACE